MKKQSVRIACLILALLLFAGMAIASSSNSDRSDVKPISNGGKTDNKNDNKGNKDNTEKVTIQEAVLVEQNGLKITAKEYVIDSIWGDGIKLLIENESEKDWTVSIRALIVNDYMVSDLFSATVAAGKKANETMNISSSDLKAAGIDSIGKIEVQFHVYDDDDWMTSFDPDMVEIRTSAYDKMDTKADDSGTELYNAGGIRIVGKTIDENSFWGAGILLYIENNSGKNIIVHCDDMSVNGFMITPYFSCTVVNGKKAVDNITILSSDLEENGIESFDEIELKFRITDADSYMTIVETDPITFSGN